jgi:putative SOS response-associated peptidase YedK
MRRFSGGKTCVYNSLMCSHYDPLLDREALNRYFGVDDILPDLKDSLWPGYMGPFVRKHEHADVGDEAVPFRELMVGAFGMIPHWAKDMKITRQTYNARSETVHEKPSFRDAWRLSRHCIIPATGFFEPDWRSGKAKPTRIVRTDGKPIGIAGLWTGCKFPSGDIIRSFTMLTVNADDHPFMRNYHKPGDEKRMIVILHEDQYDAWLSAPPEESRQFLRQYPAELLTVDEA